LDEKKKRENISFCVTLSFSSRFIDSIYILNARPLPNMSLGERHLRFIRQFFDASPPAAPLASRVSWEISRLQTPYGARGTRSKSSDDVLSKGLYGRDLVWVLVGSDLYLAG